ncbi:MAG TPA: hypothetical protein VNW04_03875 [Puia sp.]|nr:hypothetical protein [Puia sp.]
MKTNSINAWLPALPESTTSTFTVKPRRNKPGIPLLLQPPNPPDEETIRRLNELASKNPFCIRYKVREHELL